MIKIYKNIIFLPEKVALDAQSVVFLFEEKKVLANFFKGTAVIDMLKNISALFSLID